MIRFDKNGKIIIRQEDLYRKPILLKNYKDKGELSAIQSSLLITMPNSLPIPIESFGSYNKFRVTNGLKAKEMMNVNIVDIGEERKHKPKKEKGS